MTFPFSLRRGPAALIVTLVVSLVATSFASATESPAELREQRRQVQQEAAAVAGDVNALTGDVDELTAALDTLRANVDAQQAALDGAERRVADAEAAEAAAEARIAGLETKMDDTQDLLQQAAVDAFTGFQGPDTDLSFLTGNPWKEARTESLVNFGTANTADLIDELRSLGADLESEREAAAAHTAEVELQRAEVAARATELADALAQEEATLTEVESRLDARLAEAAGLAELDAQLAGEIQAEERRIAEAIAARSRSNRSVSVPRNAPVDLTQVGEFVVNVALAENLEGFLAAMESQGFVLSGSGYRDSSRQTELRRAHCGSSDYAIYEAPSYSCSPPTARPGQSEHERGLALDFTYNGSIIQSRSSAVFQAMQATAGSYGLYNLASEPWHWSTTGN